MQRIGFVGIGLMGQQMSRRLLAAGFPLMVWNRTQGKAQPICWRRGRPGEIPQGAWPRLRDVVITMVTDSAASEAVICGPQGVLEGAHPGTDPDRHGEHGPGNVPGHRGAGQGQGGAHAGRAGHGQPQSGLRGQAGDHGGRAQETFDACLPIFQAMGVKIIHVGENGKGTTLKLINNLIMGVAIQAVAEALVLAQKAGIDPGKVHGDHLRGRRPDRRHGDPRAADDHTRFFAPLFRQQHVQGSFHRPQAGRGGGGLPPGDQHRPGDAAGGEEPGEGRPGFLRRHDRDRGPGEYRGGESGRAEASDVSFGNRSHGKRTFEARPTHEMSRPSVRSIVRVE